MGKKIDTIKIWTCCPDVKSLYLNEVRDFVDIVYSNRPDFIFANHLIFFDRKIKRDFLKKIKKNPNAINVYISKTDILPDLNFFDYAFFCGESSNCDRIKHLSLDSKYIKNVLEIFRERRRMRPNCYFVSRYIERHENVAFSKIYKLYLKYKRKFCKKIKGFVK